MKLDLDAHTTALILIDLQKGILSRPLKPYDTAQIVQNSVALAQGIKKAGGIIVAVNVAFATNSVDQLSQPVDAPNPPEMRPPDWSELVPEIMALNPELHITKRQWGAFFGTELDMQLRRRGINTIVLGGVATNMGVESTAREAWQHNYNLIVAEDACSTMAEDMHQFAMTKIFPRIARVRKMTEISFF